MIWRAIKGALIGAAFVGGVAALLIGLMCGIPILVLHHTPIERSDAIDAFPASFLLATTAGIIVGAIAGFAARLREKAVPMLHSVGIVATCAALGSPFGLLLGALVGALVGGAMVVVNRPTNDADA